MHACSLKKCFPRKKIMISFSTAAMDVTNVDIDTSKAAF
jgi:hypothetical protein